MTKKDVVIIIYTSYFNNPKVKNSNLNKFSIAIYQYCDYPEIRWLNVPKATFFNYKKGAIDFEQLSKEYLLYLLSIENLGDKMRQFDNCILLCHEKDENTCHRSILSQYLNYLNIDCKEL